MNPLKSIAVPKSIIYPTTRRSYVMPGIRNDIWTRSSVKGNCRLKVYNDHKGTELFVRQMSIEVQEWSSELVVKEFSEFKANSINNNIEGVNTCVKSLLGMSEFWLLCDRSIKK